MSAAVAEKDKECPLIDPVTGKINPQHFSDVSHHLPMNDEQLKELFIAMLNQSVNNNARTVRSLPAWIAAGVATLALLVAVTGARWTNAGESDLRKDIAVLAEKLTAAEDRQKERERIADRERALIDERYRQVSIALETRGIKLPNQ